MKSEVPKVKKRIVSKDNKSQHVENYDVDNCYPQRMDDIINASGTAQRSVEVFAKFIVGGGFKDKTFYKAVINKKGLTADKLLRAVAKDYARKGGRAYHINYNGLLQKVEVSHIPFEYCRIGIGERAGQIAVYDDWDCSKDRFDAAKIKWYWRFTSDQTVLINQIQAAGGLEMFNGHILYDEKYPLAPIDPVLEDVISDKSIKTFTKKELDNGFNPSAVARYTKSFEGKEGDEEWEQLTEDWKDFQGPENTGKIILQAGISKDDFELTRFDNPGQDKMYESTNARVKKSIRERFGQPPSLLGSRADNATFSSQNIEDDTEFYNTVTSDDRLIFEEDMKMLFENFHIKINETNDWSILQLSYTDKTAKISSIGIEPSKAAQELIINQNVDSTVKINILQVLYGFTLEEAQKVVLPINGPVN